MGSWIKNDPGERPLCIVGAGFQLSVLKPCLPTTESLISETVKRHPKKFPILKCLVNHSVNTNLNFISTHRAQIATSLSNQQKHFVEEYRREFDAGEPRANLAEVLARKCGPVDFVFNLLGLELKIMVALQYETSKVNVRAKNDTQEGLNCLISRRNVTWISLNYDLVLESLLERRTVSWDYAFHVFLDGTLRCAMGDHSVIKPHGSLNVWFKTIWDPPNIHEVEFVDPDNRLATCPVDQIGYTKPELQGPEFRPWMILYVPEFMKEEVNTPGEYGDSAHDLCKWNLTSAALCLRKATALYILGYSMPPEDEWIWNRLKNIENKAFSIYVASGAQSDSIVSRLMKCGFANAQKLSDDGKI